MSENTYYSKPLEQLECYQKLIQYWSMIFNCREKINVLDNMNFNMSIFDPIISSSEIDYIHRIEPGYTSPDGYTELHHLVRELEYQRLLYCGGNNEETIKKIVSSAGVGCGNGCTNVVNAVLMSIIKIHHKKLSGKPEIVLSLPNYTVYTAQLSNMKGIANAVYAYTQRSNYFLPTFSDIANVISPNTIAIVITYPTNPAQSTYERENVKEIKKILDFCQKNEIFLIVDNIYQDLIYGENRKFTEIFSLTDRLDYIIKVYSSSKDTPFYSGYRMGYWFGDPCISEAYRYYISSTENSLNTYSMVLFAYNMFLKSKVLSGKNICLEDMDFFQQGCYGWSESVNRNQLYEAFLEQNILKKYKLRIENSTSIQKVANAGISQYVKSSAVFSDYINQNIGNVFFIKVSPNYYNKSDEQFFKFLLEETKCGVLPGNVFGLPYEWNEVWFRITLIHDSLENIIHFLEVIEHKLKHSLSAL